MLRLIAGVAALLPCAALAHEVAAGARFDGFRAVLFALLFASAFGYLRGVAALWKRSHAGGGIAKGEAIRFALGWLVLAVALVSPLDAAAEGSFALHMVQHELLMAVAAPLLVTGRPLEAWTWALPPAARPWLAAGMRWPWARRTWSFLADPVVAFAAHAAALWLWHVPAFFEAALRSEAIHVAQHASFLVSALFFWWSVLPRAGGRPEGWSLASLFATMLHTGALGALLSIASSPWYEPYAGSALAGPSPLEDQQLGGLIMWVPASTVYIGAGLAIVARWLRETPRETRLR